MVATRPKNQEFKKIHLEQHDFCYHCGKKIHPKLVILDHVVPLSLGGKDELWNTQLLCRICDEVKGRIDKAEHLIAEHTSSIVSARNLLKLNISLFKELRTIPKYKEKKIEEIVGNRDLVKVSKQAKEDFQKFLRNNKKPRNPNIHSMIKKVLDQPPKTKNGDYLRYKSCQAYWSFKKEGDKLTLIAITKE